MIRGGADANRWKGHGKKDMQQECDDAKTFHRWRDVRFCKAESFELVIWSVGWRVDLFLVHLGGVVATPAGAPAVLLVAAVAAAVTPVLLVPLAERLAAKGEVVVVNDGGLDPGLRVVVGLGHVVVVVRVRGRHGCGFCRLWCHFVVNVVVIKRNGGEVLWCFAHSRPGRDRQELFIGRSIRLRLW
jgi:hypothetical protein